jgi:hypothetical protein
MIEMQSYITRILKNESDNQNRVKAIEKMMKIFMKFHLSLETLQTSISLFSKVIENESLLKGISEDTRIVLIGLVCVSISSKYHERISFKLSDLLKIVHSSLNIEVTPEGFRSIENKVLCAIGFKVGGEIRELDLINSVLNRIQECSEL